jgi:hypothetical protein
MEQKQRVNYSDWWKTYGFEAMLTARIPQDVPLNEAHKLYISEVLRPLALHMKTKLAAYTLIVPATETSQKHLHSLVLSNNSMLAVTTLEAQNYLRSLRNKVITHELSVDISPIFDLTGACDYATNHITEGTEFIGYNDWLIKKHTIQGATQ